jgi:hypothetical protein
MISVLAGRRTEPAIIAFFVLEIIYIILPTLSSHMSKFAHGTHINGID